MKILVLTYKSKLVYSSEIRSFSGKHKNYIFGFISMTAESRLEY